jgi:DNA repair protein RadA/Sms
LYGGDENNRFQVANYVNHIAALAKDVDCAVLLLGHPGKAEGSEYSGSTAWNGSVRSRLLLKADAADSTKLRFARPKANYTDKDDMLLQWSSDGVLQPAGKEHMSERDRREADLRAEEAKDVFLRALHELTRLKITTSHSVNAARHYAPKMILGNKLAGGFAEAELRDAMNDLIRCGRLVTEAQLFQRPNRTWKTGLAEAEHGDGNSEKDPNDLSDLFD